MRSFVRLAAIAVLSTSGACTMLPEFVDDEVTIGLVVKSIKCEFHNAVLRIDPSNKVFDDWNVIFKLTLVATHKGSLSTDGTYTHPLFPGTFTLPFSAGVAGEAKRSDKIEFSNAVKTLRALTECGHGARVERSLLGGNIGIDGLLGRARESIREAKIDPTQLDYTLDFTVGRNASLSPKYNLIPLGAIDTLTAGLKWEGSRGETHTLNITLKENPAREKCLFPDIKERYGVCPPLVAVMPAELPDPQVQGVTPKKNGVEDRKMLRVEPPPVTRRKPRDVSPEAQRDLERALDRSILQDTREDLRRLRPTE